jgi:hypothetical protein
VPGGPFAGVGGLPQMRAQGELKIAVALACWGMGRVYPDRRKGAIYGTSRVLY